MKRDKVFALEIVGVAFQGDVAVFAFEQVCKIKRMESAFQLIRRLAPEYMAFLPSTLRSASELGVRMTNKTIFALFRSCSVLLGAKGVVMSRIAAIILALIAPAAFGETYTLVFDSKCSTSGEKLEFSCKPGPAFWAQNTTIFLRNGNWLGLEGANQKAFPLGLIKNDEYVIVFDYPVLYSGIATIVLIKKTGRFYTSEIAYSNALNVQEVSIEAGRFTVGK